MAWPTKPGQQLNPHGDCGPGNVTGRDGRGHFLQGFSGNQAGTNVFAAFREQHRSKADDAFARIVEMSENAFDPRVKLAANIYVVDRILGKPKETHEVTGRDGAAIAVAHLTAEEAERELAAIFHRERDLACQMPALPPSKREKFFAAPVPEPKPS